MEYIKTAIWGPDPKDQMRKINLLLRKNKRELDRSLGQLQPLKKKTEGLIKKAAKSGDAKTAKIYARELINVNNQYKKLHLSKTRLELITMAVNEQWQMKKLTQSMQALTGVMKDVNSLIHVGAITNTMQELSKELMKAGIINEMVDDMVDLDVDDELEEESQEEVNKIIQGLTEDKFSKIESEVPSSELPVQETSSVSDPVEQEQEEDENLLNEMQQRLRALQES
ncbi:Snf7-domain-containing protein [Metschnikowia bicuspidata var. bicuspidata NRRL YB-4993]|uniref:Snf7-domain-containing protein n=1 Tax=Metschnikowia bicuspidata var. bicuspidata NRRL YB-4993 TaxID=869754 RepID=A0A1A0HHG6_9ASCO|nr:Snf7-domain-containing protein [Metschnikowia bicuspidata var. bicuspidata NRRL YB-4993]OBA23288.1 Snf7-domain-containing protein [Metschnikowia bicuspidata var. bicuspidata NRRL YB-4993]